MRWDAVLGVTTKQVCVGLARGPAGPAGPASRPIDSASRADWLTCADGQRLFCWWLCPPHPHGVVWYVLGLEDGAAPPYPRLSKALLAAGFAVALVHPRGSGLSPGRRGDVDDLGRLLGDCRCFRADIDRRFPDVPVFLVGHSAGAAFAADVAATGTAAGAGVVLANAVYRLRAAEGMTLTWRQYAAHATNFLFRPSAPVVDVNSRPALVSFAPDREEGRAMQRDPLVVRRFSMRMLLAQKRLMDRLPANVAALDVPVLVVQGAYDALVDPQGNDELLACAKAPGSVKLCVPDGGHGSSAVETAVEPLVRWLEAQRAACTAAVPGSIERARMPA